MQHRRRRVAEVDSAPRVRSAGRTELPHPTAQATSLLHLTPPAPSARELRVAGTASAAVKRRDRLGGLIHAYSHAA